MMTGLLGKVTLDGGQQVLFGSAGNVSQLEYLAVPPQGRQLHQQRRPSHEGAPPRRAGSERAGTRGAP